MKRLSEKQHSLLREMYPDKEIKYYVNMWGDTDGWGTTFPKFDNHSLDGRTCDSLLKRKLIEASGDGHYRLTLEGKVAGFQIKND